MKLVQEVSKRIAEPPGIASPHFILTRTRTVPLSDSLASSLPLSFEAIGHWVIRSLQSSPSFSASSSAQVSVSNEPTLEPHQPALGCRVKFCTCYRHAILPRGAQGRNFNSCFHVRRIGIYNPTLSEEVFTTQGLKVRFTEKGIERLRKLYNGKALKLVFADKVKWCDCTLKCLCCPCKLCNCECCPEMKAYDLIIPGEAFIDGTDVQVRLGVRGTACCLTIPVVLPCALLCANCCENKVNIHHTEYGLVDHEGDFIAPNNISMERSLVKGPASPRSRGKEAGGGVHGFAGPNETVLAAPDGVKLELKIQQ